GDAVSLLQTAEGAFNEMTDILQRMKDLSTQAATDTNGVDDRAALQAEYDELSAEITNIMGNTKYAGEALFTGGKFAAPMNFQIGASSAETLALDLSGDLTAVTDALTDTAAGDLSDAANAGTAID